MNDIIRDHDTIEALGFIDPRKYKRVFTVDNEPIYVLIGTVVESIGEQVIVTPNRERHTTGKEHRKTPDECIYYTADDIAEILGASKSKAYKII